MTILLKKFRILKVKHKIDGGLDMAAVAGVVCGLIIGICVAKITKKRK